MGIDNKRIEALREWCSQEAVKCVERSYRVERTVPHLIAYNETCRLNFLDLASVCNAFVSLASVDAMAIENAELKAERDLLAERLSIFQAENDRYCAMVDCFTTVMDNPLRARRLLEAEEPTAHDEPVAVEITVAAVDMRDPALRDWMHIDTSTEDSPVKI